MGKFKYLLAFMLGGWFGFAAFALLSAAKDGSDIL